MSIFVGQQDMMFASKEHYEFYHQTAERLNADCYLSSLIYAVGISSDTRRRWEDFYDEKERLKPEVLHEPWQTGTSRKITRLAFQLYTDSTPTAHVFDEEDKETPDFQESQRYSVSDVFCCECAPFFVEAVKLRYPEYFTYRPVYNEGCRIREEAKADQ